MAAVTIHSDSGAQENKICHYFDFSPSICHEVMRKQLTKYSNVKAEIVNLDKRQNPTIRGLKETFLDIKTQQTESEKKGKRYTMKIIMKGGGKRLLDKKDYSLDIKINILYAKEPIHQKQLTIINAYVPKKIHEGKLTE